MVQPASICVSILTPKPPGARNLEIVLGQGEAPISVFRIDAALDGLTAEEDVVLIQIQRQAASDFLVGG
jgi:hypothetical protein